MIKTMKNVRKSQGRPLDEEQLYQLYLKGNDAQKKNNGFPLTYEQLQKVWGYSSKSKSMVSYYMPKMAERGYVKTLTFEKKKNGRTPKRKWLFIDGVKMNSPVEEPEKEPAT